MRLEVASTQRRAARLDEAFPAAVDDHDDAGAARAARRLEHELALGGEAGRQATHVPPGVADVAGGLRVQHPAGSTSRAGPRSSRPPRVAPLALTKRSPLRSTITTMPAPPAPRAGLSTNSRSAARRAARPRTCHWASQTWRSAGAATPPAASAAFVACLSSTTR